MLAALGISNLNEDRAACAIVEQICGHDYGRGKTPFRHEFWSRLLKKCKNFAARRQLKFLNMRHCGEVARACAEYRLPRSLRMLPADLGCY